MRKTLIAGLAIAGAVLAAGCTATVDQPGIPGAPPAIEQQDDEYVGLTPEVANAARSAENYVEYQGFSRQGLIDQLSSDYADQYPADVAEAAVRWLEGTNRVNWYEEAVETATNYLKYQGFSRQGLIDQMTSQYGDQYTIEEANHAADEVGL